jgi:hypothetical protein
LVRNIISSFKPHSLLKNGGVDVLWRATGFAIAEFRRIVNPKSHWQSQWHAIQQIVQH